MPSEGSGFGNGILIPAKAERPSSLSLWAGILNQLQLEPLGTSCDASQGELL